MRSLKDFRAAGVPHRRIEDWKYTDLRATLEDALVDTDGVRWHIDRVPGGLELFDLAAGDRNAPDWVVQYLGDVIGLENAMGSASLALARSGVAIRVQRGLSVVEPIELHHSGSGHVRVLLVLEEGASATLIERDSGEYVAARNIGSEFVIGDNAQLTHVGLHGGDPSAVRVQEIAVTVARGGHYRGHFAQRGAKLSRLELYIGLNGEGAEASLSGVSVLGDETHADVTTHIDHAVGKTTSRQLFKNVAGGHSRAVYQGKITVRKGANGSDSRQTAKALLLSARAEADLKPELEIFADDVKCAHGAAVGDLDADSLFYLRTRGIPEADARALLIHAFLDEALAEVQRDDIRGSVAGFVAAGFASLMEERS
jgi:Fe-S cluster assembly protein SufD